jgi:RimJ/RimL family protein N-acetyltransferase
MNLVEQRDGAAPAQLVVATRAPVIIRALEPCDRDGVRRLLAGLSAQSRHQRFLGPKPDLTIRELELLTSIDHVHHEAFAACDEHDRSIVAIVRYIQIPERPGVAEIAAEVADAVQRMGIALTLAKLTIERARANGLTTLTAIVLWDNHAARAALQRLGFCAVRSAGTTIELELQL